MVNAVVTTLQGGPGANYTRMIATAKGVLGYHLESWAGDAQYRLSHSFNYSETDLQQYYMASFRAAMAANVSAIMCSYDGANGTNPEWPHPGGKEPWGVPICAHPDLQRLLRTGTGWRGYIITDAGAITFMGPGYHDYASKQDSACLVMNAGTDLALGSEYASTLATCLARGNVTTARVYEALTRLLTAQFNLGWFDTLAARRGNFSDPVPWNDVGDANITSPEHRALARTVALESLVLLKKAGRAVLPLVPSQLKRVALIGPAANFSGTATSSYLGNYAGCEDGPGGAVPSDPRCHVVSLTEALVNRSTVEGWQLAYSPGCDVNTANSTAGFPAALAAAAGADVIIAAVGLNTCQETACSEGEANDRGVAGGQYPAAGLDLPGSQLPLLQALRTAYPSTPLVVVLLNGGTVSSPWMMAAADAVLEAWYQGLEGGSAIAAALFGEYSPAGRMPVTTLSGLDELPLYTDFIVSAPPGRTHWYYTGTPLLPFGFGLSYANFTYANLTVTPSVLGPSDVSFTVSATVTHTGGMVSDEVPQLYGHFNGPNVGFASIPLQQLLAFQRLHRLAAGSTTPVSFTVAREALTLMSPSGTMGVQSGRWTLWLGGGPPSNAQYGGGDVLQGALTVQ
jgi:beta-glucosidase